MAAHGTGHGTSIILQYYQGLVKMKRLLRRWLKGLIIGICNIKIGLSSLIENIALVEGLKHNLLSISQLYDKDLRIIFYDSTCDIIDEKSNSRVLFYFRENNIYIIDMLNLKYNATCLTTFREDSWL